MTLTVSTSILAMKRSEFTLDDPRSTASTLTVSTSILAMKRPEFTLDDPRSTACAASAAPEAHSERTKPKCPTLHTFKLLAPELQEKTLGFLDLPTMLKAATVSKDLHQMITGVVAAFLQNHFRQAPEAYETVLTAIGPMGRTPVDSQQAFGQGFLRYLSPSEDKHSIDAMCTLGLIKGFHLRFFGYRDGLFGYPKDFAMTYALNEALADQGNTWAMGRRICGYAFGSYGYPHNPAMAFKLNEALADQGNEGAIDRRIKGYTFGAYGYPQNPKKACELNEALADQGNERAINRRIDGYSNGLYGYPQNPEMAFKLNEALADQGNEWAIDRRIKGYSNGLYGYPQNPEMAFKHNEALANQGNEEAINSRIMGYKYGVFGYPRDSEMFEKLNASRQDQRTQTSLRQWIQGSMGGDNCLEHSPCARALGDRPWTHQETQMLCDALISTGHPKAIAFKLKNLTSESPGALYPFSPGFEEAMMSLIKTFLPKKPEASVPASAAAATDDRGGFE